MKIKSESESKNEFKVNIVDSSSHIKEKVDVTHGQDESINNELKIRFVKKESSRKVSLDNLHKKK